jgi:hypothetical protein
MQWKQNHKYLQVMLPFKHITRYNGNKQIILAEIIMCNFEKNLIKRYGFSTCRQGASSSPGTPSPGGPQSLWPQTKNQKGQIIKLKSGYSPYQSYLEYRLRIRWQKKLIEYFHI